MADELRQATDEDALSPLQPYSMFSEVNMTRQRVAVSLHTGSSAL